MSAGQKKEDTAAGEQGIVCIGDSLTAGFGGGGRSYPAVLSECLRKRAAEEGRIAPEVVNLGVNGEDTVTILGRTGAVPFRLTEKLTVKPDGYPVPVSFASPAGGEICPLVYGDAGLEKVWLTAPDGTEIGGRLTLEGGLFAGERYCFRAEEIRRPGGETERFGGAAGAVFRGAEGVEFPAGTRIETAAARRYRNYLPIALMGANGQFETVDELMLQYRVLLSFYRAASGRCLVLGLHLGDTRFLKEEEEKFSAFFGRNFLDVRTYMCTEALRDAGISPTETDLEDMRAGRTPGSLLFDGLHFNSLGYELLGKLVYRRLSAPEGPEGEI